MTKTVSNIVVKYQNYYKAWLTARNDRIGYEASRLLMAVEVLESVLVNDCNLGYKKVAEIRNQTIADYYKI